MEKSFVRFYSPGTFVSEMTEKEIESWDVKKAVEMSKEVKERHGATPYGFMFITRGRKDNELDSKELNKSCMYYLGGKIYTIEDIIARNDPKDQILISNMKCNGYKVIENNNSYKITLPFNKDDVLLNQPL